METKRIALPAEDTIDSAIAQIKVKPSSLFIILADFDDAFDQTVLSLCSRALIPAAINSGSIIIDNGSNRRCDALFGQAALDAECGPLLISIQPHPPVDVVPNHSILVQLPSECPNSMKAIFQIAAGLAAIDGTAGEKPVLTILFGGGKNEMEGLLRSVRRGWPILIVQGSGGIADEILTALELQAGGTPPSSIADPEVREIIETADTDTFPISGNADDLHRILMARIDQSENTLADSWSRYDDLDAEAIRKQKHWRTLQVTILSLGILATLFAILWTGALPIPPNWFLRYRTFSGRLLHILIVLTPIAISILIAASSRFREGNKWIHLRSAAEAIKSEIFRYRMKAAPYTDDECAKTSRESKLAARMKDISLTLVQTEVNRTSIASVSRRQPERLTFLQPEEYLKTRLDDQISYFTKKIELLYKRLKKIQFGIYLAGGTGTFLAAFNQDIWVALTTALATAFAARLEMDQIESSLVRYNQALTNLRNIRSWWNALSQWERKRRRNIDLLVEQTEKTLEGGIAGWVHQMQTTLDKLTEKQESAAQAGSPASTKVANV